MIKVDEIVDVFSWFMTNNNPVWIHKVINSSAFSQKLRVASNYVVWNVFFDGHLDNQLGDHLGSAYGHSWFLNYDNRSFHLMLVIELYDVSDSYFSIWEIIGFSFIVAKSFSWSG